VNQKPPFLPETLPIFPLARVLLLPSGNLPLNIFEPRYLNMVADALGQNGDGDGLIGMVQPRLPEAASRAGSVGDNEAVYQTGCAGRITDFSETKDGPGGRRILISVHGLIRFNIAAELPIEKGYRRIRPNFSPFLHDLENQPEGDETNGSGRERVQKALKAFLSAKNIELDWDEIRNWSLSELVTIISMTGPFGAGEKQALLECARVGERAELLVALMEMPVSGSVRH
jgi:Lon protease-like protein